MLPPDYYEDCADDIVELYSQFDEAVISDITRRIVKTGTVTETAKWQIKQAQEMGLLYSDILREIAKRTDATAAIVKALFEDAGVKAVKIDGEAYKKAGKVPIDIRQSPAMLQVLEAGYKKTLGNMKNLTLTTANTSQTAYINACNSAYMKVSSGAFSYQEAIKQAIQETAQNGTTVLYPSGHTDRIDVAVRRSVMTGLGQTCRQISLTNAEEMDCDLLEISAHSGARPSHAVWQGQIVSRSGRQGYLTLSDIGFGTGEGFGGWNCQHDWYPYFEGISTRNYTQAELDALNEKSIEYNGKMYTEYEISQIQRRYEREIRAAKREQTAYKTAVEESSGELKEIMQTALTHSNDVVKDKQAKMREFIRQTGQQRDYFREQNYSKVLYQNGLTSANDYGIFKSWKQWKTIKKNPNQTKDEEFLINLMAVNASNFATGEEGYQMNCQRCVVAYEMRRRGYDVIAKPYTGIFDNVPRMNYWSKIFKNSKLEICEHGKGIEDIKMKMSSWGDGARAIVKITYPENLGHLFFAEYYDGEVHFYDPQTGSADAIRNFNVVVEGGTYIMRVDNLEPTKLVKKCCEERK